MATRLGKVLTDVRKSGELWWLALMADQGYHSVRVEGCCLDEPLKIHTVVNSTQHAKPSKATRCKESLDTETQMRQRQA
jgi:S-adenosylmethionine synthetase